MRVSLIIITYNRPQDTLELIEDILKLKHQHLLKEVIILNNNSSVCYSPVEDLIKDRTEINFQYVKLPENLGVSKGRNYATSLATGDLFLFFDDDILLPDKDFLPGIMAAFEAGQRQDRPLGILSFQVLYASSRNVQVNAFPHKDYRKLKNLDQFTTYYYPGCAHVISRQAWQQTGPYPEDFFYGMEEYDLSFRAIDKGFSLKYINSVTVLHKESPLGRVTNSIKLQMMWVNKCKVAWRHLPGKYFYTTAFMWSFFFLVKTRFSLTHYLAGWIKICRIPGNVARQKISTESLKYLEQVGARLYY